MTNTKKKKGKAAGSAPAATPRAASTTAQTRSLRNCTITARAAASLAQKVPAKARFCRTCQKPRAGPPKQCTLGPSTAHRLEALEEATLAREQESMAEEADFLAASDAMDTELDQTDKDTQNAAQPTHKSASPPPIPSPAGGVAVADAVGQVGLVPPQGQVVADANVNSGTPSAPEQAQLEVLVPVQPEQASSTSQPTPSAERTDERTTDTGNASAQPATDGPAAMGAPKPSRSRKCGTDSDDDQESGTEPLLGGLKSTPAGDLPLPMKRSPKNKDTYTPRMASKKATEMFKSMAVQGDLLSSRVPGWAFCMFVPMERRGEMRSWSSPQVRALVPDMPARLREVIFEHLEPFREQADDERELLIKMKDDQLKDAESELERYKRLAADAEQRAAEKEREAEGLRIAYAAAQQLVQ